MRFVKTSVLFAALTVCFVSFAAVDFIVKVDGEVLTQKQLDEDVALRMYFFRKRIKSPAQLEKQEQTLRTTLKDAWINSTLLKAEAQKLGINPSDEARKALEKKYQRIFLGRRGTFKRLQQEVVKAGLKDSFDRNFNLELYANSLIEAKFKSDVAISEKDIDSAIKRMDKYNARASLTNELIFASASNIVKRARAGEDFAKLADTYSQEEDKRPGGYKGECDDSDFSDEEPSFARAIWALKDGEISDVLDSVDAYTIVKMIKHVSKDGGKDDSAVEIAWIKLYKPQFYPEYSRDELRKMGVKQQRTKVLTQEVQRLRKKAKIEYPSKKSLNKKGEETKQ